MRRALSLFSPSFFPRARAWRRREERPGLKKKRKKKEKKKEAGEFSLSHSPSLPLQSILSLSSLDTLFKRRSWLLSSTTLFVEGSSRASLGCRATESGRADALCAPCPPRLFSAINFASSFGEFRSERRCSLFSLLAFFLPWFGKMALGKNTRASLERAFSRAQTAELCSRGPS